MGVWSRVLLFGRLGLELGNSNHHDFQLVCLGLATERALPAGVWRRPRLAKVPQVGRGRSPFSSLVVLDAEIDGSIFPFASTRMIPRMG